jgi:hypothetical protein
LVIGPGLVNYETALRCVREAPHDPDNTLALAITMRELACLTFGMLLVNTLFPECADTVCDVLEKIEEVSEAQEFLPRLPHDV